MALPLKSAIVSVDASTHFMRRHARYGSGSVAMESYSVADGLGPRSANGILRPF